jgi:hypothetical protein
MVSNIWATCSFFPVLNLYMVLYFLTFFVLKRFLRVQKYKFSSNFNFNSLFGFTIFFNAMNCCCSPDWKGQSCSCDFHENCNSRLNVKQELRSSKCKPRFQILLFILTKVWYVKSNWCFHLLDEILRFPKAILECRFLEKAVLQVVCTRVNSILSDIE